MQTDAVLVYTAIIEGQSLRQCQWGFVQQPVAVEALSAEDTAIDRLFMPLTEPPVIFEML